MGAADASSSSGSGTALINEIDRALAQPRTRLKFPAPLEARFYEDRAELQTRRFRFWGLVGAVMFNLFNFTDQVMVPDVASEARWIRMGLVTPAILLLVALAGRGRWRQWHEALLMLALLLISGSVVYLFVRSLHPNALQYHTGVILTVMFGMIVMRQRFGWAMATSTIVFAMYAVGIAGLYDMPIDVKLNCLMVMLGAIVISLMACFQMEADVRRGYLMALKQSIEASQLRRSRDELDQLSKSDPLTGLDNRRSFDARLMAEWSRAQRNHEPIALLFVDIDHFKDYNDHYGHQAGDTCLVQVAQAIRESAQRGADLCARYGGEEFVVLLPQTTQEHALGVARRVRRAVERLHLPHPTSKVANVVTVSVGVSSLVPTSRTPWDALLEQADRALYEAKASGRNQVRLQDRPQDRPQES